MQSDVTQVQKLNLNVFAPSDYYRYALCESGTEAERMAPKKKIKLYLALKAAAFQSSGVEGHSSHQYSSVSWRVN